ncbi:MAG: acyl-[acyl-carrier-protein]-phospholipid O-acyltransferase [Cryomorphaceae bacterium]|jgi:acyl-[acyl-carrier-protein]-phospholipid O-acyltransferase/long-chain-fatty-acid--[acyl-carrier-protein] ligase
MSKNFTLLGTENIPLTATLIVPGRLNHQEILALELQMAGRKIIWLCEENVVLQAETENYLADQNAEAASFSVSDPGLEKVGSQLIKDLGNSGVAIFLPGKVNALHGAASHIEASTLKALCALKLPVTPLAVHDPMQTRLKTTTGTLGSYLVFRPEIAAAKVNPSKWQQANLLGISEAFNQRPFLQESLGYNLLKGLQINSKVKIIDGTNDQERNYGIILGIALAFAKYLKEQTQKQRVAIILPPGIGGLVANLAVIFAGKIPVNINFTASHEAIKSCISQADVDKYITADPFVRKVSDFPWPPVRDLIHVERILPTLKKSIKRWVIVTKLFPIDMVASFAKIKKTGGDEEAVLLFTSGSSGAPKGVPLTHRNLLANVCQFSTRLGLPAESSLLGCLPLFHSFGCTGSLWFPIIQGVSIVSYPSPLDTKRLAELIEKNKVTFLLSTPTFLRGYMRRVKPEQLASVKIVITGAEKLPTSLAESFYKKFGIFPQEGYGLTETSPATNFNVITPPTETPEPDLSSAKTGSVGQFLSGIAVKVTDAATDKESDIDQSGIIWLKGSNIFPGYLNNQEKTDEVFENDWFKTGDVGRVDEDGFLHIEGRISRFSKIAGEMVPHETLEASIIEVLGLDEETERKVAVVGIPDEKKGEAIILLSCITDPATASQSCIDLRYKLLDAKIPSLWCPKDILTVSEIPILASGKLDIKGCENLVAGYR